MYWYKEYGTGEVGDKFWTKEFISCSDYSRQVLLDTHRCNTGFESVHLSSNDVFLTSLASVLMLFIWRRFLFCSPSAAFYPSDTNMFVQERADFRFRLRQGKLSGIQSVFRVSICPILGEEWSGGRKNSVFVMLSNRMFIIVFWNTAPC